MTAAPWKRRRGSISSVIRAIQPASSARIRKCRPVRKPSICWLCRQRWTTCPVICGRLRKARPSIPSGGLSMTGPWQHGWRHQAVRAVQGLFHTNLPVTLPEALVRRLFAPDGTLRGSVTKFEQYRSCPFCLLFPLRPGAGRTAALSVCRPPTWACWSMGAPAHHRGKKLLREQKQWHDIPDSEVPGYLPPGNG